MTQTELAERSGWTQERISALKTGRYGLPSLRGLAVQAAGLEVGLADVIQAARYPLGRSA